MVNQPTKYTLKKNAVGNILSELIDMTIPDFRHGSNMRGLIIQGVSNVFNKCYITKIGVFEYMSTTHVQTVKDI